MALRILKGFQRINSINGIFGHISKRLLLSEAYGCRDAWKSRLESPCLQKIDPYLFATKLQESFDRNGKSTAVDMDILANKISQLDTLQLDYVQNLFYRFRHCAEAKNVRGSMSHAFIRALLDMGETERLLNILKDKIHYGIFLDYYTANLLLDNFLRQQLYKESAEIAIDLMLQEDFCHPLTRAFSWYAAHLRLKELITTPEEPTAEEVVDEEDVKYRRIRYIVEPWYDDHFDIPTEKMQLGKTLTSVTELESDNSVLVRSCQLIGWAFYQKFDKGLDLIRKWLELEIMPAVTQQELDLFGKLIEDIVTKEPSPPKEPGLLTMKDRYPFITADQKSQYIESFKELSELLKSSGKVTTDIDVESELLKLVNDRIANCEATDIADQKKLFAEWEEERSKLIQEQIERYRIEEKKRSIAERLIQLTAREEKLRYFEQQVRMDLKISEEPYRRPIEDVKEEEQFVAAPGERRSDTKKSK